MKKVTKLKPLLPSLREKKRYIGFEILSDKAFSFAQFNDVFSENLKNFIGFYGLSKAGTFVVKEKYDNNKGIIRVNNNHVDIIKASFTKIKKINDTNVIVRSIRTSGMINKVFSR